MGMSRERAWKMADSLSVCRLEKPGAQRGCRTNEAVHNQRVYIMNEEAIVAEPVMFPRHFTRLFSFQWPANVDCGLEQDKALSGIPNGNGFQSIHPHLFEESLRADVVARQKVADVCRDSNFFEFCLSPALPQREGNAVQCCIFRALICRPDALTSWYDVAVVF